MSSKKDIFWMEYIFRNCNMFFRNINKPSLEIMMNIITIVIIFLFLIFSFFGIFNMKILIFCLFFSIIIINILYYKQKNKMICNNKKIIENFDNSTSASNYNCSLDNSTNFRTSSGLCKDPPYNVRINYNCQKPANIQRTFFDKENSCYNNNKVNVNSGEYNSNFKQKTDNQNLVGKPNPKTLIPPIFVAPASDIDYWRNKDSLTLSVINSKKERYNEDSGYNTVDLPTNYETPSSFYCGFRRKGNHYEYSDRNVNNGISEMINVNKKYSDRSRRYTKYNTEVENQHYDKDLKNDTPPTGVINKEEVQNDTPPKEVVQENFTFPYEINDDSKKELNEDNSMIYKNFKNNKYFEKDYNDNIHTDIFQPGFYRLNERIEPVNSNIGISFTPSFQKFDEDVIEPVEDINMSNVYDPRFYGYSSSDRCYIENVTGQPRFYYDDIDAIKMPNYISRNHLDVFDFGDSTGSMENEGNKYTSNIRNLANNHYMESQLQFRNEITSRLMKKNSQREWQLKNFPINSHSQR